MSRRSRLSLQASDLFSPAVRNGLLGESNLRSRSLSPGKRLRNSSANETENDQRYQNLLHFLANVAFLYQSYQHGKWYNRNAINRYYISVFKNRFSEELKDFNEIILHLYYCILDITPSLEAYVESKLGNPIIQSEQKQSYNFFIRSVVGEFDSQESKREALPVLGALSATFRSTCSVHVPFDKNNYMPPKELKTKLFPDFIAQYKKIQKEPPQKQSNNVLTTQEKLLIVALSVGAALLLLAAAIYITLQTFGAAPSVLGLAAAASSTKLAAAGGVAVLSALSAGAGFFTWRKRKRVEEDKDPGPNTQRGLNEAAAVFSAENNNILLT